MTSFPEFSRSMYAMAKPDESAAGAGARRVSVVEGHDLWAETYDRVPNPLLALEEREMELLLPHFQNKFVLDIACGTGRWLRKLLRHQAGSGIGLDLSTQMVARAQAKLALRGKIIRADCLALPLRDRLADLIVCSFAVGYISDLPALGKELARVARSGARVVLSDFHPSAHARGWQRAFRRGSETIEISSHQHSIDQLCQAMQTAGFELRSRKEPCLDEPERGVFEGAGKAEWFERARREPAIFICLFQKTPHSGTGGGPS